MNGSNSFNGNGSNHHQSTGTRYVVSEDVDVLIARWCLSKNLLAPTDDLYVGLRAKMKDFLQDIFAKVTFVNSQEIRNGLLASVAAHRETGLTVISLERAYLNTHEVDGRLELTRSVDGDGRDLRSHSVRKGTPDKRVQFERLRDKKIALIEDVVYSGETLISTISDLHQYHTNVHAVTSAIGKKKGVDRLKGAQFGVIGQPKQMTICCLKEFDDILDQVCERDFYPGVPYSGREHFTYDNVSYPYVLPFVPFGKLKKWASIEDEEAKQFSCLCIDNTIALFEEIERANNITISCQSVPRPVYGSPKDGTRFVDFLKEKREQLLKV